MNNYLKKIIKKIQISFSLFIPGAFRSLHSKNDNNSEFENAYILSDQIHQENTRLIEKIVIEENLKIHQFSSKPIKLSNTLIKIKARKNPIIVLLGFVTWFFKIKEIQLPSIF